MSMNPTKISKSPSNLASLGLTPFGPRSWFPSQVGGCAAEVIKVLEEPGMPKLPGWHVLSIWKENGIVN